MHKLAKNYNSNSKKALAFQLGFTISSKLQSRSQRGFTLIELIIAITIVVILTTLAVTSFNSSGRKFEVKNQAQEIVSLARKLKTDAIASSKTCPDYSPGVPRSYYGTTLGFKINRPDPLNVNYGHSYKQISICYLPPGVPGANDSSFSPSPQAASIFKLKNRLYVADIDSVPNGFVWFESNSMRTLTISFTPDGQVSYLDNGNPFPDSNLSPTPKSFLQQIISGPPYLSVHILPQTYYGAYVTLTDGQNSVRMNFMKTGLICSDEGPFTVGNKSCAGYTF